MSRNVDLTKPLQDQDRYDIQYALDRNLISDPDERRRAFAYLNGHPDEVDGGEGGEGDGGFNPTDASVKDVVAHCEQDEVSAEEVQAILEREKAGKNRSTLVEALEDMLVPADGDEGEGSED